MENVCKVKMQAKTRLTALLCAVMCAASLAFVPGQIQRGVVGRGAARACSVRRRDVKMGAGNFLASLGLLVGGSLYPSVPGASSYISARGAEAPVTQVMVAKTEKEVRQGVYGEYTVDKQVQKYDSAEGTFKTKEETGQNRNKYIVILTVLLIGSAVIPMVQYWWYVKDEQ